MVLLNVFRRLVRRKHAPSFIDIVGQILNRLNGADFVVCQECLGNWIEEVQEERINWFQGACVSGLDEVIKRHI